MPKSTGPSDKQNKATPAEAKSHCIIAAMCDGLKPVKTRKPAHKYMTSWLVASLIVVALMVAVLGLRYDAMNKLHESIFIIKSVVLLFLAAICAYSGFRLGIPDCPTKHRFWAAICFGALAFWFISLGHSLVHISLEALMYEATHPAHGGCAALILATSGAAGALMYTMLHDAFPVRPMVTGLATALAATTLGFVGASYFCYVDAGAHMILFHLVPVLLLTAVFSLIVRKLIKR